MNLRLRPTHRPRRTSLLPHHPFRASLRLRPPHRRRGTSLRSHLPRHSLKPNPRPRRTCPRAYLPHLRLEARRRLRLPPGTSRHSCLLRRPHRTNLRPLIRSPPLKESRPPRRPRPPTRHEPPAPPPKPPKRKRSWLSKILIGLAVLVVGAVTVPVLAGAFAWIVMAPNLPSLDAITAYHPKIPLRIFTADHVLIGEFGEERRRFVPFDQIPDNVQEGGHRDRGLPLLRARRRRYPGRAARGNRQSHAR